MEFLCRDKLILFGYSLSDGRLDCLQMWTLASVGEVFHDTLGVKMETVSVVLRV